MSNYEEQEYIEYCDRLTWRFAPLYLMMIAAYPMATPNPNYEDDF
jgi:hypothetical protein